VQSLALVYLAYAEYQVRSYRSVLGISGQSPSWVIAIFWIGIVEIYTTLYARITQSLSKRIGDGAYSAERP